MPFRSNSIKNNKLGGRTRTEFFNITGLEATPASTRASVDWTEAVLFLLWNAIAILQQESRYPIKVSDLIALPIFQELQTSC